MPGQEQTQLHYHQLCNEHVPQIFLCPVFQFSSQLQTFQHKKMGINGLKHTEFKTHYLIVKEFEVVVERKQGQ